MAEDMGREHFIPIRQRELLALLLRDIGGEKAECDQLRRLHSLLASVFHHEFHSLLNELKDHYAPFDPDLGSIHSSAPPAAAEPFLERFTFLMERANFHRLTLDEIKATANGVSAWGLNMDVDFGIFEMLEVYVRGDTVGSRPIRHWYRFWRKREIAFPKFTRLVLLVKLRPSKRVPAEIDTTRIYLKLFKDIPTMDIEMLFPGAYLKMPAFNRVQLGSSLIGSGAWIAYNLLHEILAIARFSSNIILGPAIALLGYGYKQWYGYQSTRNHFYLRLTQSLFYQTLGSNQTVLSVILDEAEEQECREAILGYYYLWRHAGATGWTAAELDTFVENDIERLAGLKVDFEIKDALSKLERLKLVRRAGDRLIAEPIDAAIKSLGNAWTAFAIVPEPRTQ